MVKVIQPDKPKPDEELNLGKILEEKQKATNSSPSPSEATSVQPMPATEQQASAPQLADKAEPLPPQTQQSQVNQVGVPTPVPPPVGPNPSTVSPQQPQVASVPEPSNKKSKKKIIIIGAVVVGVIVLVIVGYVWYSSSQTNSGNINQSFPIDVAPLDSSPIPAPAIENNTGN